MSSFERASELHDELPCFAALEGNYRFVGMDLALEPEPFVVRTITHFSLEVMGFEELIPRYPDIEQMLLDCAQGNC